MTDGARIGAFLDAAKSLADEPLVWIPRNGGHSYTATAGVVMAGVEVGDLVCVQVHGFPRNWVFSLKLSGLCVLDRHYEPEGSLRGHKNRPPRPPGFPAIDRSPIHDHPWIPPDGGRFSRPVDGAEQDDHAHAFHRFCRDVNINPAGVHRDPPLPQISFPT